MVNTLALEHNLDWPLHDLDAVESISVAFPLFHTDVNALQGVDRTSIPAPIDNQPIKDMLSNSADLRSACGRYKNPAKASESPL